VTPRNQARHALLNLLRLDEYSYYGSIGFIYVATPRITAGDPDEDDEAVVGNRCKPPGTYVVRPAEFSGQVIAFNGR